MPRHFALILFAPLFAFGCGADVPDPLSTYLPRAGEEAPAAPTASLLTVADRPEVSVGESLVVRCWQRRPDGGLALPSGEVTVTASGPISPPNAAGNVVTVEAVAAGELRLSCRTTNGDAIDSTGTVVRIRSLPAFRWTVSAPRCAQPGQPADLEVTIYDRFGGNVDLFDAQVQIAGLPSSGVVGDIRTGLVFTTEGDFDLSLSITGPRDPGGDTGPKQVALLVDGTPPRIELTSPKAGAMIPGTGAMTVTGIVRDNDAGLSSVEISGQQVAFAAGDSETSFSVPFVSKAGLNIVEGHVEDTCGNATFVAQPFMRGTFAAPVAGPTTDVLHDAFTARLGQSFVDDGNRSDLDDLLTLGQTVLSSFDFAAAVPPGAELGASPVQRCNGCPTGPTRISTGFAARRHPDAGRPFQVGAIAFDNLNFVAGGVGFGMHVDSVSVPLQVDVDISQCNLGCERFDELTVNVTVGFDRLAISGLVGVDKYGPAVRASVADFNVSLSGAFIDMDCGAFDFACDGISNLVLDSAVDAATAAASEALELALPAMLEDSLSSFAPNLSIELPAPINKTLGVQAQLDRLTFCGPNAGMPLPVACAGSTAGGFEIALGTHIYPAARGMLVPSEALGALRMGGSAPALDPNSSFGMSVRLDALNELLWALWYSGALHVTELTSLVPAELVSGVEAAMGMALPPTVVRLDNGALALALGGVHLDASVDIGALLGSGPSEPMDIAVTMSMIFAIRLELDGETQTMKLTVDDATHMAIELERIGDIAYASALGEALGTMMSTSLPAMLNEVVQEMPMPQFDLSGLPGVPDKTIWQLRQASLETTGNNITFQGVVGL